MPCPLRQRGTCVSVAAAPLRVLLLLLCLACLGAGAATTDAQLPLKNKPNIIFVMVDALRADHLGCYGYDLPTTPNIDRFARESMRFEHAVAQSSWTIWSLASLMTSRFPPTLLTGNGEMKTRPGTDLLFYPMLAEILKKQGYATSAVTANPLAGHAPIIRQGFDDFDETPAKLNRDCSETSSCVTDRAIARVQQFKDRRFFLFLHYMDPHAPYHVNTGFADRGFQFGDSKQDEAIRTVISKNNESKTMAQRRESLRAYDSEIGYTDYHLGRFLAALQNSGVYDDAMIVLFADHGEEFFEHGGDGHMDTVYQEVLQVPLIIKYPRQREGKVVAGVFPLIDLMPSALLLAGIEHSTLGLQGKAVNLPALLRCAEQPLHSFTIQRVHSVINGRYKLIQGHYPQERPDAPQPVMPTPLATPMLELFDLLSDPLEQHNLFKEKPEIAAEMLELLKQHAAYNPTGTEKHPLETTDVELLRQLEALGYINK